MLFKFDIPKFLVHRNDESQLKYVKLYDDEQAYQPTYFYMFFKPRFCV